MAGEIPAIFAGDCYRARRSTRATAFTGDEDASRQLAGPLSNHAARKPNGPAGWSCRSAGDAGSSAGQPASAAGIFRHAVVGRADEPGIGGAADAAGEDCAQALEKGLPRAVPSRARRNADAVIRDLAARQHGVVERTQLLRAGVPRHVIGYRLKSGRVERVYSGVYRVGPVGGRLEGEMAAVLACGPTAVLSHGSASAVQELLRNPLPPGGVEVSVLRGNPKPGRGVRVHQVTRLEPDEQTVVDGVPITSPARTLLDIAGRILERDLEDAMARVERASRMGHDRVVSHLATLVARYPRRPGTRALRAILRRETVPAFTRSEAEARFLDLVRLGRLPPPRTNVRVAGHEVDFLWPAVRLIVEIDGFAFHGDRGAFERDRRRDAVLVAAGFRVVRVTWRQLVDEPHAVLVRLAAALARGTEP